MTQNLNITPPVHRKLCYKFFDIIIFIAQYNSYILYIFSSQKFKCRFHRKVRRHLRIRLSMWLMTLIQCTSLWYLTFCWASSWCQQWFTWLRLFVDRLNKSKCSPKWSMSLTTKLRNSHWQKSRPQMVKFQTCRRIKSSLSTLRQIWNQDSKIWKRLSSSRAGLKIKLRSLKKSSKEQFRWLRNSQNRVGRWKRLLKVLRENWSSYQKWSRTFQNCFKILSNQTSVQWKRR